MLIGDIDTEPLLRKLEELAAAAPQLPEDDPDYQPHAADFLALCQAAVAQNEPIDPSVARQLAIVVRSAEICRLNGYDLSPLIRARVDVCALGSRIPRWKLETDCSGSAWLREAVESRQLWNDDIASYLNALEAASVAALAMDRVVHLLEGT
jgi:hypothetical protein